MSGVRGQFQDAVLGESNVADPYAVAKANAYGRVSECSLPPDSGECLGEFIRVYFDSATQECKTFYYGGCGGNPNRFTSFKACYEVCSKHEAVVDSIAVLSAKRYVIVPKATQQMGYEIGEPGAPEPPPAFDMQMQPNTTLPPPKAPPKAKVKLVIVKTTNIQKPGPPAPPPQMPMIMPYPMMMGGCGGGCGGCSGGGCGCCNRGYSMGCNGGNCGGGSMIAPFLGKKKK